MEDINAFNEAQVGVVDQQTENVSNDVANVQEANNNESTNESVKTSEIADQNSVDSKQQSKEENKAFAEMRKEIERLKKDAEIAREYGSQGIYTYEDYQKALNDMIAQEQGVNPEFYSKYTEMEKELSQYKQEKELKSQAKELEKDPVKGEFYSKWKDQIHENAKAYNVDLETSLLLTLGNNLGEFKTKDVESIKKEAVKEYIEQLKGNYRPVESGGVSPSIVASEPKTFEEARKNSLSFLKSLKK